MAPEESETPLVDALGIKPDFLDEVGPRPNKTMLRAFLRDELSPQEQEEVLENINSYRRWFNAFYEVVKNGLQSSARLASLENEEDIDMD